MLEETDPSPFSSITSHIIQTEGEERDVNLLNSCAHHYLIINRDRFFRVVFHCLHTLLAHTPADKSHFQIEILASVAPGFLGHDTLELPPDLTLHL